MLPAFSLQCDKVKAAPAPVKIEHTDVKEEPVDLDEVPGQKRKVRPDEPEFEVRCRLDCSPAHCWTAYQTKRLKVEMGDALEGSQSPIVVTLTLSGSMHNYGGWEVTLWNRSCGDSLHDPQVPVLRNHTQNIQDALLTL